MWPLDFFVCFLNVFLFTSQISPSLHSFLNVSTLKTHILTKTKKIVKKSWNYQKYIFHKREEKNTKKNCQKKVLVYFEEPMGDLWTHKNYFWQNVLLFFFHAYEKYICHYFKKNSPKKLVVLSSNVFSHYNTFLIECTKGLLLDVNKKNTFFKHTKTSKGHKT